MDSQQSRKSFSPRFSIGIPLLALLLACFSLNYSLADVTGSFASGTINQAPQHSKQVGFYSDDTRASEHFSVLLASDLESNDEELITFELVEASCNWKFESTFLSTTLNYNKSRSDRRRIPLYTLHHSWKSFLS